MPDRHVIRLQVVVHGDLPVHIPVLDVQRAEWLQRLEPMRGKIIQEAPPDLLERRRIAAEAREYESELDRHARRLQSVLAAIEAGETLAHRHADQLAAQPVGPAMVRAGDGAGTIAGTFQNARASMPAHVVKYLDRSLRVAHG